MNALSCFFTAFLLFSSQAHGISSLSLSSEASQALSIHSSNTLEHFSERFAQAKTPTQEDFVEGISMRFSCTAFYYYGEYLKYTYLFTLSEAGVVHPSADASPKYFVFNDLGLMGVSEGNYMLYRNTWKIESNGKWIGEWAQKLKKDTLKAIRDFWKNTNLLPSAIDPDYRVISYSVCKQRAIVKTKE